MAVLGAKVFFLVASFVQQPLLRLAMGLGDYGALAQALILPNMLNNVIVASGTQGVSRAVASAKGREDEALRATLGMHTLLAIGIAAAMVVAAPLYSRFEHAEDVTAPLLVMAGCGLPLRTVCTAHRLLERAQPVRAPGAPRRDLRHPTDGGPDRGRLRIRETRRLWCVGDDGRLGGGRRLHRSAGGPCDGARQALSAR